MLRVSHDHRVRPLLPVTGVPRAEEIRDHQAARPATEGQGVEWSQVGRWQETRGDHPTGEKEGGSIVVSCYMLGVSHDHRMRALFAKPRGRPPKGKVWNGAEWVDGKKPAATTPQAKKKVGLSSYHTICSASHTTTACAHYCPRQASHAPKKSGITKPRGRPPKGKAWNGSEWVDGKKPAAAPKPKTKVSIDLVYMQTLLSPPVCSAS